MHVTYEFTGRASQENFRVAEEVANAMMLFETTALTSQVLQQAAVRLNRIHGDEWQEDDIRAYIDNCEFISSLSSLQIKELNAAVGEYQQSPTNPAGVSFSLDTSGGDAQPYKLLVDDCVEDSFSTYKLLLEAAMRLKQNYDFQDSMS